MIDCDKSTERKGLRKVVNSKERSKDRKGRKTGGNFFFIACASLGQCICVPLPP